jgi:hypothetical protein
MPKENIIMSEILLLKNHWALYRFYPNH